jgi:membrane protein YdbS with pleckstrin-like domain
MRTLSNLVLQVLKVPPEPRPPAGDPSSLRVFRAGLNFWRLRVAAWVLTQVLALAGIAFWTTMLIGVEQTVAERRAAAQMPGQNTTVTPAAPANASAAAPEAPSEGQVEQWKKQLHSAIRSADELGKRSNGPSWLKWWASFRHLSVELGMRAPPWVFPWIWVLKIAGFLIYLAQIPITYAIRRFDYEMRWYMVTDRSLRLRHGVVNVTESTMSFANIQRVMVSQGPVQRLLGLANVKVQSAGGGGKTSLEEKEDMHVGFFQNVTNAHEIRDLILERLRRFREAGLGDPDDRPSAQPTSSPREEPACAAAHELLSEAKALRAAVELRRLGQVS